VKPLCSIIDVSSSWIPQYDFISYWIWINYTKHNANFANYSNAKHNHNMLTLLSHGRICVTCLAGKRYLQYQPLMNDTNFKLRGIFGQWKKSQAYNRVYTVIWPTINLQENKSGASIGSPTCKRCHSGTEAASHILCECVALPEFRL
jgi:hypothetical protein